MSKILTIFPRQRDILQRALKVYWNEWADKRTTLIIQQVVLLQQLPVHQQTLGGAGRVKDNGVFAQKLLEHIQFGLASLFKDKHETKSLVVAAYVTWWSIGKERYTCHELVFLWYFCTYWTNLRQQCLLRLTEKSFALNRCYGLGVKLTHGLPCEPNN